VRPPAQSRKQIVQQQHMSDVKMQPV
jgi:hypothetical protein